MGFIIDVVLKGFQEEAGSIIIVLRLWRVFKIVEELSAGASEQMDDLREQVVRLKAERDRLLIAMVNVR